MIAVAFVAAISAMGIVPILGTRFFGTTTHAWTPKIGKGALLSAHAPMCPTRPLLRDFYALRARAADGKLRGGGSALPPGCLSQAATVAVNVLDLKEGRLRTAYIQLASGMRYWVFTTDLVAP